MRTLKLLGYLRTAVLGAVLAVLLTGCTGVGLLLSRPDPGQLPVRPYEVIATVLFAVLVSLSFGTSLSVRVLSGLRPLQAAPDEITRAVRAACDRAGVPAPTCWGTTRRIEQPVVLRGLRQSHLIVSPAQAGLAPDELAGRCARRLADGSARVTLLSCTVFLALRFWINLAGYCASPWRSGSRLPFAARTLLFFLPLFTIVLAPLIAVSYLMALLAAAVAGPATSRALVEAFGTSGGRPRIALRSRPDPRFADWFAGAALRSPRQQLVARDAPDGAPAAWWRRPAELSAGMSGVASVYLVGVLLLAVLSSHWPAVGITERFNWGTERAVSAPVVAVEHESHGRAMISSLGDTWAPTVRLDGGVLRLPPSTVRSTVGGTVALAVSAGRVRNREQDAWAWLLAGALFTGLLLLAGSWAAARERTSPATVAACRAAQDEWLAAGSTSRPVTPAAPSVSVLERLRYRARTVLPVWLAGLLISAALATVTFEPLGALLGDAFGQQWTGRRIGFLGGTALLFAAVVGISISVLVWGWTDQDYQRWLARRFDGSSDTSGGFSTEPLVLEQPAASRD